MAHVRSVKLSLKVKLRRLRAAKRSSVQHPAVLGRASSPVDFVLASSLTAKALLTAADIASSRVTDGSSKLHGIWGSLCLCDHVHAASRRLTINVVASTGFPCTEQVGVGAASYAAKKVPGIARPGAGCG
jgi:hypothetical protein